MNGRTVGSAGIGGMIAPVIGGSVVVSQGPWGGMSGGIKVGGILGAPNIGPMPMPTPPPITPRPPNDVNVGMALNNVSRENNAIKEQAMSSKSPIVVNNNSGAPPAVATAPIPLGDDMADPRSDYRNPFARYQDKVTNFM
jgi:hypothetical protein